MIILRRDRFKVATSWSGGIPRHPLISCFLIWSRRRSNRKNWMRQVTSTFQKLIKILLWFSRRITQKGRRAGFQIMKHLTVNSKRWLSIQNSSREINQYLLTLFKTGIICYMVSYQIRGKSMGSFIKGSKASQIWINQRRKHILR